MPQEEVKVKIVARIAPVLVLFCGVTAISAPPAGAAAPQANAPAVPRIHDTVGGYGGTVATIHCFANNGNLVNSGFAIQFVAAVPIA